MRVALAKAIFPSAVLEPSPYGGVDIRIYDKPNETRTWPNFDPYESATDSRALVEWIAESDDLFDRYIKELWRLSSDKLNKWKNRSDLRVKILMTASLPAIADAAAKALGIEVKDDH